MLLTFDVKNQIIVRTDTNRVIANSSDYIEVSVTFTDDWIDADKMFCFKNGDVEINVQLVNNAIAKTKHINLGVGTWKVYVIGIKGNQKILTNEINVPVGASGYIGTTGPTSRVYEELLEIINSLHTEAASTAVVRSAVEQFCDENFHDIVISDVYSKSEVDNALDEKVDKEDGKGLSENDFTDTLKDKLDGIASGAEVNVQSDWNEADNSKDEFIKNKPTLGTAAAKDFTTSIAEGNTNLPTSESVKEAIDTALSSVYKPAGSKAVAELTSALLIADNLGNVYDMLTSGTTTADFVEGAGITIEVGDNVSIVDVGTANNPIYKFDLLSGMIDLSGLQTKTMSTPVTVDGTQETTVEGAIGAINTLAASNKTVLGDKVDKVAGKGLSENDYTTTEKTKLSGISTGANKVESSTTNGNIKIDGAETQVYDDSEIRQDLSTDTATVTGNPLNFTTLTAQKAVETVISLEPIQDLHGYDHPWPGGGGKNKLPLIIDEIKAVNTKGTWNGNVYTYNGITYTFILDADGNILGINASGTAGSSASFFGVKFDIADNISIIGNGCPNGGSISTDSYRMDVRQNTVDGLGYDNAIDGGSGTKTFTTGGNTLYFSIRIAANYKLPTGGLIFQPMIRLASESNTFAPYSNTCPIDGRTETSLVGCGKNQLLMSIDEIKRITTTPGTALVGTWNGNIFSVSNSTLTFEIITNNKNQVAGIKVNGTAPTQQVTFFIFSLFKVFSGNYTLSGCPSGDGNSYRLDLRGGDSAKVDIGEGINFVVSQEFNGIVLIRIAAGVTISNKIFYPMLRLATNIDATYEPYTPSNNLTIQFGEKVYGGTVDVESGTVTVDRAIVNVPHAATDWNKSSNSSIPSGRHGYYGASDMFPGCKYSGGDDNPNHVEMLFNQAESGYSAVDVITSTTFKIGIGKTGLFTSIWCNTDFATKEEWLTYLTNNPLQVCYPLATPRTITLTPNEISLLLGVNNISTDGDGITLTYRDGKVATLGDLTATNENVETNTNSIQSILGDIAPVEQTTATQAHSAGELLLWNNMLVKVTDSIAVNDTLVLGTNVDQTTIAAELALIVASLA